MEIKSVIKRDGTKVAFDKEKIVIAIGKAVESVYDDKITKDEIKARAEEYADEVTKRINGKGVEEIAVEDIQDIVEQTLMEKDSFVAKAYIIYRNKRAELRNYLATIGITDDLKLPLNTLIVLAARYLQRDENRKIIETPKQLFERVSKFIAGVEHTYGTSEEKIKEFEESIYKAMTSFEFMPNSPTLMNAGTKLG
ncbi:MAG: ribonucleotide reductase N-terminal alpha domain-containing protein, partial [Candidatus Micrarchaeaceae archaeon]